MDDITIKLNSRTIERVIWIIVVILLMVLLIWTNWEEGSETIKDKLDTEIEAVEEIEEEAPDEEVEEETEEVPEEEQEVEEVDEEEEAPEEEEEEVDGDAATATEGTIVFTVGTPEKVNRISTGVKKTQYLLKSEDFASMEALYFKIDNNKKDFIPTINVYIYDSDDVKQDYMETITFIGESEKGKILEKIEKIHVSFNELDKTKTFEVELVDNGVTVKTYKKTFNFG
jgi:hypothetical protein